MALTWFDHDRDLGRTTRLAAPKCNLLHVDDSENDRMLFRIAVKQSRSSVLRYLYPVGDGDEAIDYLAGRGRFSDRERFPFPDVMVLDLKMPGKPGFEVLEWMHSQGRSVVTLVLSDSEEKQDVARAMALGALEYHKKPETMHRLVELVRRVERVWCGKLSVPVPERQTLPARA